MAQARCALAVHSRSIHRQPVQNMAVPSFSEGDVRATNTQPQTITISIFHMTNHHHRMFKAAPNIAHIALAKFTLPELRHSLSPDSSFTMITQNIDGLDRRAIENVHAEAGSANPFKLSETTADPQRPNDPLLIEMHGHIGGVLCTSYQCRHRELNLRSPICPALAGTELLVSGTSDEPQAASALKGSKRTPAEARAWAEARFAGVKQEKADSDVDPDIPLEELPRCTKCGGLARPDVVWFTEVPQRIDEVMRIVDNADVCIVVGTSAVVGRLASVGVALADLRRFRSTLLPHSLRK